MLIEMVAVTLSVVSSLSSLTGYLTPEVRSPVPEPALKSSIPEEKLVAMLEEPTPTPTPTNTPTPTATPTPTNTPTPSPTPIPQPVTSPVDLEALFSRFAGEYSVDKELLKRIAKCESSFNSEASFGDYLGMFQFASSSWQTIRARMGHDPNPDLRRNAEETIKTAAFHIAGGGAGAWPSCK